MDSIGLRQKNGRGRMGGYGLGPGGECICPKCGYKNATRLTRGRTVFIDCTACGASTIARSISRAKAHHA